MPIAYIHLNSSQMLTIQQSSPQSQNQPLEQSTGCPLYDQCPNPKRERKAGKRRSSIPSIHLTSDVHLEFVRVCCKESKKSKSQKNLEKKTKIRYVLKLDRPPTDVCSIQNRLNSGRL